MDSSQTVKNCMLVFSLSVLSLVDALGTLRGAGSSWHRSTSPLLPSLPVCFLFLIWAVSVLTETAQPGLFINSCKLEAAADRKGGGEMHFFSSSFFLHPAPSLPALLLPPSPFSLISCVKVSGAILASLDLCGSEWENAAVAEAAVCYTLIELPELVGFLPSWVLRLIYSRSFVIKSFQPSCLLVWMLNYWRRRE